jgi:hypothetical protein
VVAAVIGGVVAGPSVVATVPWSANVDVVPAGDVVEVTSEAAPPETVTATVALSRGDSSAGSNSWIVTW